MPGLGIQLTMTTEPRVEFNINTDEISIAVARGIADYAYVDLAFPPRALQAPLDQARAEASIQLPKDGRNLQTIRLVDVRYHGHSGGFHHLSGRIQEVHKHA